MNSVSPSTIPMMIAVIELSTHILPYESDIPREAPWHSLTRDARLKARNTPRQIGANKVRSGKKRRILELADGRIVRFCPVLRPQPREFIEGNEIPVTCVDITTQP